MFLLGPNENIAIWDHIRKREITYAKGSKSVHLVGLAAVESAADDHGHVSDYE